MAALFKDLDERAIDLVGEDNVHLCSLDGLGEVGLRTCSRTILQFQSDW